MSLESFIGLEADTPMSESAFEAFQERMNAASAQIAAIRKEEKKQKKNEDELLKILFKFIKSSQKSQLVLLVSRTLAENIPANFILTIILLGNPDIQQEVGKLLMIEGVGDHEGVSEAEAGDKALIFFREDQTLPLKVKIELDNWLKGLLFQAEENPHKLLKTAYNRETIEIESEGLERKYQEKKNIKNPLIRLVSFVVEDYLKQQNLSEQLMQTENFATFVLKGILSKTEENLDNRKSLE